MSWKGTVAEGKVAVLVNGTMKEVDENLPFEETISSIAKESSIRTFDVEVLEAGKEERKEIESPDDAPENLVGLQEVRIIKHDEAGD